MDVQFIIDRTKQLKQDVADEQEINENLTANLRKLQAIADGRERCMLHLKHRVGQERTAESLQTQRLHNLQIEEERALEAQTKASDDANRSLRDTLCKAAREALLESLSRRWEDRVRAHFQNVPEIAEAEELRKRVREAEAEGPRLAELKEMEEHVSLENLSLQRSISDKEQKEHELQMALKACKGRMNHLLTAGEKETCRLEEEAQGTVKVHDAAYAEVGLLQQNVFEAHGRLTQKEKDRQRLRQLMRST